MKWQFWKAEPAEPTATDGPVSPRPTVWNPGWEVELFAKRGEPRWCATSTAFEVSLLGTERQQYWERRLRVFGGHAVYIDQQQGRPIVETADLLMAIGEGRLVYFPPSGGEVYRTGVVYTVAVVASTLGPKDLALHVADVQSQLGGVECRLNQCRRVLTRWAGDPSDENTQILHEHYYCLSTQARRYLMGMDAKDNGLRMFFEATDERQRAVMREALLNTCRLYADEFKL